MNGSNEILTELTPNITSTLCVAQYWRGRDISGKTLPLHWALFAIWNATPESLSSSQQSVDAYDHWGTCYQAIGNIDTFAYQCSQDECMEILADSYRGCLRVGEVPTDSLAEVEAVCGKVQVWKQREDWNCQNWVLAALEKLKRKGWVDENVTPNAVRNELEEMWQQWSEQ